MIYIFVPQRDIQTSCPESKILGLFKDVRGSKLANSDLSVKVRFIFHLVLYNIWEIFVIRLVSM